MTTFVLVHGVVHGAWCWQRIIGPLRDAGHAVIASAGDVVLTERVDTMYRADGTSIIAFRIMGAIELRDGLIVRYTDYLDSAPIRTGLAEIAPKAADG
jgi:limonene-1,2-epoxide hydrolase